MPKSLPIEPSQVRKSGTLKIPEIPLNQYTRNIDAERARFGNEGLRAILHDMIIVREFETMLNSLKTMGAWEGIEYNHKGPAHLSIGQEAAVVGQAAALDPEDFIFGSHRSHGEILSKCLSAARKLDEPRLQSVMTSWLDGETLEFAKRMPHSDTFSLARNFIVFGTLAEIFARKAGFNRGMGGSMHAFFTPFGSMPNNAIVGGSADIALGSALFKRINKNPALSLQTSATRRWAAALCGKL
jgi:Pyruvate/2-oxoglutarate dehydrogenase complex, dehydrogenase (E1) component, eukaryotic type, alpha subunit